MIDDEDAAKERRDEKRWRDERRARPAMKLIEQCIDAEEGSVAKMALKHHNTNASNYGQRLIDFGLCDVHKMGNEGYLLLDDINAAVIAAYIAGYTTAITGEVK
jgi:hypothetical protein